MSLWDNNEGEIWGSDLFLEERDWLRDCANLRLEEIRPVEGILNEKWRKKLCSLSPHVSRPGKAFIDKVGI